MKENIITRKIIVRENKIGVMKVGNINYISLTDLARYKNEYNPGDVIIKWMSNKGSFDFYCLWEELFNENFKLAESREFKKDSANQSFTMSPSRWISMANAKGFVSKRGKYYGGTYAHPDIAFEFASWLSHEFKLYLIKEFERLKQKEYKHESIEWNIVRTLSKVNYIIHTDAINECIVPRLTKGQKKIVYAKEADVLNVALFGMTAKQWEDKNPELSKKSNIRDCADLIQLIILNNLESINSELIKIGMSQQERLVQLNSSARKQINLLNNNKKVEQLELLEKNLTRVNINGGYNE